MKVVVLTSKHCSTCAMMKRTLRDSVEYIDIEAHPEAIGDSLGSLPVIRIMDGDKIVEEMYGPVPKRVLEQKVSDYVNHRH